MAAARVPACLPACRARAPARHLAPNPAQPRLTSLSPPRLQRADLAAIVAGYLSGVVAGAPVETVVDFYLAAKAEAVSRAAVCWCRGKHADDRCQAARARLRVSVVRARRRERRPSTRPVLLLAPQEAHLQDGAGHKPAYNLRTLCRALEYTAHATPTYGLQARPATVQLSLQSRRQCGSSRSAAERRMGPSSCPLLSHLQPHAAGDACPGVSLSA